LQITDANGTQLYWRRNIQPSIGYVGVPVGKIHYGENVQDAAQRELQEKTGLKDVKLVYRGTANMKFYVEDTLVSHILCLVFAGKSKEVQPELRSGKLGEAFWSDKEKIDSLLKSVTFIKDQLSAYPHGYFFAEQSFYL
jgi:ADP-ribose pyrophosphatase YjhB (NUDIX family)